MNIATDLCNLTPSERRAMAKDFLARFGLEGSLEILNAIIAEIEHVNNEPR